VPQDFGGLRSKIQARDICILREELARGDALADTMLAMQALGSLPDSAGRQSEQKNVSCRRLLQVTVSLRSPSPNPTQVPM